MEEKREVLEAFVLKARTAEKLEEEIMEHLRHPGTVSVESCTYQVFKEPNRDTFTYSCLLILRGTVI